MTLPELEWAAVNNETLGEWETLTLDDAGGGEFITLPNGAQMHYVMTGPFNEDPHPRDVVLIHGIMDSAYNWQKNMDALARDNRIWAIDLPGSGFSSRLTERIYTFRNFARWVRDFMNIVEIERASVVGHSMGGAIALQFAHDYPQRVDKLVLLDPAAYLWVPTPLRLLARLPLLPRLAVHFAINSKRAHAAIWSFSVANSPFDGSEIARRSRHLRVKGTLDALIALAASPYDTDLPSAVKKITASTLVLWGGQDQVVPSKHGERLVRELPKARLHVIQEAGHIPNQECPRIVDEAILDFLKEG